MRHKIRKGLETPCMIKGLLSSDYWMFVGIAAATLILGVLGVRSGFSGGSWMLALAAGVFAVTGLPVIRKKFKEKARPKKFDTPKKEITISNLFIHRKLNGRHYENRRSI